MKLWTAKNETVKLEIHGDEDGGFSPREDDNLGTMVCWHRRYTIGDKQPSEDPNDWLHEWRRERKEKDYVILPVFMLDHNGVALNTSGFHCPWDSGQIGYIYTTRERATELGVPWNQVEEQLQAEVVVYSQYLNGECYGFIVMRKQDCGHWEETDSCWGFYGSDWENNGLAEHLEADVKPLLKELA